jgi:hypothetical protein
MELDMAASRDSYVRKACVIPAIALAFIVGFAAPGFTAERKPADRLPELIRLVGLDTAFDHTGAILKSGMKQGMRQAAADPKTSGNAAYTEKVVAAVDPAVDLAFPPDALQREFLRAMEGRLNNADLDAIFAFFRAPLGARMTALENAKIKEGPDAPMKKAGELAELLKREPERTEVLKQLDSALRLTEISTNQMFNMSRAVAIGMAAADEKTTALPAEAIQAIDQALEKMRPALMAQLKDRIALSLTYTYREASVSELRQYVAFLKSPAGKKLYGTVVPALHEILVRAGIEFGHALMRELGKERA